MWGVVLSNGEELIKQHLGDVKSRHEKDIEDLKAKVDGVPERIDNVEEKIVTLTAVVSDFIKELRKSYVTKENCSLCRERINADIAVNAYNIRLANRLMLSVFVGGAGLLVAIILTKLNLM